MAELVKNAWPGWLDFIGNGKLAALLILVLFLFWHRNRWDRQEQLLTYGAVMTAFCIFPVTAAFLMLYQTRFYDYIWIWNCVPMVMIIAYGGVVHLGEFCKNKAGKIGQKIIFVMAVFAVTLLCGRLSNAEWTIEDVSREKQEMEQILAELEASGEQKICLWAPRDVLEYARELRGDITLFYGRNMWDKALNAYSYDVYTPEQEDCYLWMDWAEATGRMRMGDINGMDCVEIAAQMGVNRILLPVTLKERVLERIEKKLGVEASRLGDYYLLVLEE